MKLDFKQAERAKKINIPSVSEELAEDIGIQIGDGSIGYWKNSKGGRSFVIQITGNISEDEDYLINYVKILKENLFSVHVYHYKDKSAGTLELIICSKNLAYFYKNLGFPIGPKNNIKIPTFIFKDKKLEKACLRGLMDTDGSLTFKKGSHTKHNNPVIHFATKSKPLAIQVCNILGDLEFTYTANFDEKQFDKRTNKLYIKSHIYVGGKRKIKRWMKEIGFNNIAKITRYQVYKKLGYCPPYTTLQQRLKILKIMVGQARFERATA